MQKFFYPTPLIGRTHAQLFYIWCLFSLVMMQLVSIFHTENPVIWSVFNSVLWISFAILFWQLEKKLLKNQVKRYYKENLHASS